MPKNCFKNKILPPLFPKPQPNMNNCAPNYKPSVKNNPQTSIAVAPHITPSTNTCNKNTTIQNKDINTMNVPNPLTYSAPLNFIDNQPSTSTSKPSVTHTYANSHNQNQATPQETNSQLTASSIDSPISIITQSLIKTNQYYTTPPGNDVI